MIISDQLPARAPYSTFCVSHPVHAVFNTLVTASIYGLHARKKCELWPLFSIQDFTSIGLAILTDSIIPYLREASPDLPNRKTHIGSTEKWWLMEGLATEGIRNSWYKAQQELENGKKVR